MWYDPWGMGNHWFSINKWHEYCLKTTTYNPVRHIQLLTNLLIHFYMIAQVKTSHFCNFSLFKMHILLLYPSLVVKYVFLFIPPESLLLLTVGTILETYCIRCCIYYNDVIMGAMASQITRDQRKHQSSASLAFVRGIRRWTVNSPHKGPVTRKIFPSDDVII